MIIELLGPSGAGKTTLADALAIRLRQEGYAVRTVIGRRNRLFSRLLARSVGAIQSWSAGPVQTGLPATVMGLLPPRGFLWSLRLRGYISYLCGMTNGECADITLLDQGFVQLICSLVLLSGIADRRRIVEALACVPKSDLVIRVDTPLELIEARLLERRQRLGPIQRRLELNLQTSLKQAKIVEMLSEMLTSEGQRWMNIDCFDERSLAVATEKILAEVRSMPVRPLDDAATAGGAAPSPNDERQYQDRTFARRYLTAYAGPFRLKTLAAWIIATLERRHVARALRQCQPPPAVLLDVPCGTGKLAKVLATMETEVVGADLSTAM